MSEQRLIDANALIQDLVSKRGFYPAIVKSAVEQAPTVPADVVVHCENCRFRHTVEDGTYGTFYACGYNDEQNSGLGGLVQSNDYCSYGERAESEEGK